MFTRPFIQLASTGLACVRFIFSFSKHSRNSITFYIKKLNWLNMQNRRSLHVCTMMYKVQKGNAPDYLCNLFQFRQEVHSYGTRQVDSGFIEPRYSRCSHKCFSYFGSMVYNSVPIDIRSASSISSFKKLYFKHLLDQQ